MSAAAMPTSTNALASAAAPAKYFKVFPLLTPFRSAQSTRESRKSVRCRLFTSSSAGKESMADWFTVNVRDAPWRSHDTFGSSCRFESQEAPFPQLGINLRVLQPGQPNCLYHSESLQEDFLVLHGECLLFVEEEKRQLGPW